jgi:hypothetical protein
MMVGDLAIRAGSDSDSDSAGSEGLCDAELLCLVTDRQ